MKKAHRKGASKSKASNDAAAVNTLRLILRELLLSFVIVILVSVGVHVIRLHTREEFEVVVPAVVRTLFQCSMVLLSVKTVALPIARQTAFRDPAAAKRLFLLDHLVGAFILTVVCMVLALFYRLPSHLAELFTKTFLGLRERTATILSQLISWTASGLLGNFAYDLLKRFFRREVRDQPTTKTYH